MPNSRTSQVENVSRETFLPFADYVALLLKWNSKINLIGPTTEPDIWTRHINDCAQLVELLPKQPCTLVDIGSGAGLPGLVIATLRQDINVTLVEQDQRKAAFLNEAKRVLALSNVTVEAVDIATLDRRFHVVTARALASLEQLLAMAEPRMEQGAVCLFLKGANHQNELARALEEWAFDYQLLPSRTNEQSSIITISKPLRLAAVTQGDFL